MLRELDYLPEGLLTVDATGLHALLGGPTLIHLPGRRSDPLFVSVLMHGNEITGWQAIQSLLRRYTAAGAARLPRALSVFVGNTVASAQGLRRLDTQPDYNRIWPGTTAGDSPERQMMQQVCDIMQSKNLFASVDVHNNTGINPHYGCVNVIDHRALHLATLFSRTVVYFTTPKGVQAAALARLCPAVTLECGQPGQQYGVEHAVEYIDACLHLAQHPEHDIVAHDIDLFHTVGIIKVPQEVEFSFGVADAPLRFADDIDHLNFRELPAGTRLGWVDGGCDPCLQVQDEAGADVSARYFAVIDGELRLRVPVMPSMLTCDARVIRQDCLGYLMERYPLPVA